MPGRPGHYATRDGRVFDGELELERLCSCAAASFFRTDFGICGACSEVTCTGGGGVVGAGFGTAFRARCG